MDDLRFVRSSNRHGVTFFSSIDFDDVFPADSLVFPKPGDLFQTIGREENGPRKREGEQDRKPSKSNCNIEV